MPRTNREASLKLQAKVIKCKTQTALGKWWMVIKCWVNILIMSMDSNCCGKRGPLTTDVMIRASTMIITRSAIRIPLQFRWFGFADTNCKKRGWKKQRLIFLLQRNCYYKNRRFGQKKPFSANLMGASNQAQITSRASKRTHKMRGLIKRKKENYFLRYEFSHHPESKWSNS